MRTLLVKFRGVSPKKLDFFDAPKYKELDLNLNSDKELDYVQSLCAWLVRNGLVSSFLPRAVCKGYTQDGEVCYTYVGPLNGPIYYDDGTTGEDFHLRYECEGKIVEIVFNFLVFDKTVHLEVELFGDNFLPSLTDPFLENTKLALVEKMKEEWEQILWMTDEDCKLLNADLYPLVFQIENQLRQSLSDIATRFYGTSWWDKLANDNATRKFAQRSGSYSGFDGVDAHLLSIDISDLIHIAERLKKEEIVKAWMKKDGRPVQVTVSEWFHHFCTAFDNMSSFNQIRNTIAHNKLIDRKSYDKHKRFLIDMIEELKKMQSVLDDNKAYSSEQEKTEASKNYISLFKSAQSKHFLGREAKVLNKEEIAAAMQDQNSKMISFLCDNCLLRPWDSKHVDLAHDGSLSFVVTRNLLKKGRQTSLKLRHKVSINPREGGISYLNVYVRDGKGGRKGCAKLRYINAKFDLCSLNGDSVYLAFRKNGFSGVSAFRRNVTEAIRSCYGTPSRKYRLSF